MKIPIEKDKYPRAHRLYEFLMMELNPRIPKTTSDIIDFLGKYHNIEVNYMGGSGDKRRTLHENIFNWLYGYLKTQVTFGTGKDGVEKWGCRKFTVDFYDEELNVVYEIDGSSHKSFKQRLKDLDRTHFLSTLGITVYRFTNKEVQKMLVDKLVELETTAKLDLKEAN